METPTETEAEKKRKKLTDVDEITGYFIQLGYIIKLMITYNVPFQLHVSYYIAWDSSRNVPTRNNVQPNLGVLLPRDASHGLSLHADLLWLGSGFSKRGEKALGLAPTGGPSYF